MCFVTTTFWNVPALSLPLYFLITPLRLVFTSDGVVVGVVIRSLERYDLVKIKPTESEAEHWFCLWLRRLLSSENCTVGVTSRSGKINQWQCSMLGLAIGWSIRFCFRLRQPSFHWILSDGVVNGIGRNKNVTIAWFSSSFLTDRICSLLARNI